MDHTQLAKQLLKQIALDHPYIVDDPIPLSSFEGFGDNCLKLVLRCYIAIHDMPMRLTTIDELNTAIDEQFKAAGLEIAFPQRDLHLRSVAPEIRSLLKLDDASDKP